LHVANVHPVTVVAKLMIVVKDPLPRDTFRALEFFAVLYDIAIDEEQFNPDWCRISVLGIDDDDILSQCPFLPSGIAEKPWETGVIHLFPESEGNIPNNPVELKVDRRKLRFIDGWVPPKLWGKALLDSKKGNDSDAEIVIYWRKLLIAKLTRALLQKRAETTAFDALDSLGLALIRAMPQVPKELLNLGDDDSEQETTARSKPFSEWNLQIFILRILFLNEISACYQGYHSIAYADDCLTLLDRVINKNYPGIAKGQTPYELIAIYNKAQGHFLFSSLIFHREILDTLAYCSSGS